VNTPLPDLGDLLHHAVDDIEPVDRIDAIRARTAHSTARAARPWFYAAGGTVLATAAAVAAFAVLGGGPPTADEGPADHGHEADTVLVPAYFIGDTPRGERLFREFDTVAGSDALQGALDRIQRPPSDPDYVTAWAQGSFDSAQVSGDTIEVEVGSVDVDTSALAAQQLVYTLQGAIGQRLPVQLVRDGEPTGAPLTAQPQNDVLNLVSISDPAEGEAYHGSFTARGRANSFEATVHWEIQTEGGRVVREGFATASGWMDRLYPWETEIDLTGLRYGFYTFVVRQDDPSGGAEGSQPAVDTRTIIVR
jgi:hypothetical protein